MKRQAQVLGLLLGLSILAAAQETRGSLSGIVTDGSGAVVARAGLQLTNTETGVVLTTTSQRGGPVSFSVSQSRQVQARGDHRRFQDFRARQHPAQRQRGGDAAGGAGGRVPRREKITVSAEAPLIEAEKADRGMLIDNKKVVDMPINTRNPIMLAALSNGITPTSGTTLDQKPFSNSADGSWSINGGVGSTVEFLLDGAPNNTIYNGVTHGGERAVGGRGAGIQGHDQHVRRAVRAHRRRRDQHLAEERHQQPARLGLRVSEARAIQRGGVFGQRARQSRRPRSGLDQYGFTIGGPVRMPKVYNGKDKTFFFFALEKYHEDQEYPAEKVASVPTAAQRAGDFSNTLRQLRAA